MNFITYLVTVLFLVMVNYVCFIIYVHFKGVDAVSEVAFFLVIFALDIFLVNTYLGTYTSDEAVLALVATYLLSFYILHNVFSTMREWEVREG